MCDCIRFINEIPGSMEKYNLVHTNNENIKIAFIYVPATTEHLQTWPIKLNYMHSSIVLWSFSNVFEEKAKQQTKSKGHWLSCRLPAYKLIQNGQKYRAKSGLST